MTKAKCKQCEVLRGNIIDLEVRHQRRLDELLNRSGMDLSPCRQCGITVILIPDGLALCKDCAGKDGE